VNDLRQTLAKSMPCPSREPGVLEQNEHRGNVFLENFIYERTTASSRNLDSQKNAAVAIDRQTSVRGSQLPHGPRT